MAEAVTEPAAPPAADTSGTAVTPHALKGWAALQYAANVLLPDDLSRAANLRAATLRELGV